MELNLNDLKKIAAKTKPLLKSVGSFITKHWFDIHDLTFVDKRDASTEIDIKAQNLLMSKLHSIFPNAGFIVEEGKSTKAKNYNWVIDPIDGTKNYINGVPLFYTQIALIKYNTPILGHIYNPISDQFFSALRNNGAYLNGVKVVSKKKIDLDKAIIDVDFGGSDYEIDWKTAVLTKLVKYFYRVRITGAFLATYLATDGIDGHVCLYDETATFDLMPREIILREAGNQVEYISIPKRSNIFLAGKENIFEKIKEIIRKTDYLTS